MKILSFSPRILLIFAAIVPVANAFQWMSKFKMPTYDPQQELVKEKFGDKKLVVITGCSSGLGRKAAQALLRSGEYHVVGAVRDLDKMEAVAELDGFDLDNFTPMQCELNSFASVRDFCDKLEEFRMSKPIDRLICNAGVYQPTLDHAKWSLDNHEQTMQINFLSHFLMISKLMESMIDSTDPRVIMVGSVTGNDNTVGGGGVYPIADLHELDGFKAGFKKPIAMADGYGFIGAKAYKDSKLCLMMTANYLHAKYHKLTGISFASMYPGCIAESPLFREKREWFRTYFPIFMKFITGGFVGEHEAGQRLFQTAHDPRCSKSGVYWSWNGGPREGRGAEALEKGGQISGGGGAGGGWDSIFENDQSSKVLNIDTATKLFEYSTQITGAEWPELKQITSPCPTLKVIGAVTQGMVKREELKRMREMGRPGFEVDDELVEEAVVVKNVPAIVAENEANTQSLPNATPKKARKLSKRQRVVIAADKAVGFVVGNTVGRVARFAGKRILGRVPETAKTSSFFVEDTVISVVDSDSDVSIPEIDGQELLEQEIMQQLRKDSTVHVDQEDEALFAELYREEVPQMEKPLSEKDVVSL
ncbi:NADPH-protochlorophyllide oxidoreductase [Nitzschia inconspicua]|uniref:NADPH-protochlorophyllide oxidoreductase n=1 Tax=Nitzschia inconspicua TaxID=303405 RepID=A0A9K3KKS2_9STRA|nr:NADPH-protochlorophyllide oxidoreductase [Nitzschia inconspicua]